MTAEFRAASAKLAAAERAASALDWLKSYGPKGDREIGRDQINAKINAKINMNYASACAGATEAAAYLEEAAQFYMGDICNYAIALAEKHRAIGEAIVAAASTTPAQTNKGEG